MIPFASQRGGGQDLAAHLLNEHDNDYMEVSDLRGAIANDLHGAFAEWEAQAHGLTKCKKYLYSLSINPDERQGDLSREQYLDYIDRAEKRLGLSGQPRAVVFHIKHGREHAHVVWSRIDPVQEKAVHMAFDKDKLMMVTREFARDHNLELPKGYSKDKAADKSKQLSVYDMAQQRSSGLTKQDHIENVTGAWRGSDSAKAFVQALSEKGYMLATGKRPYVLIDFYGGMHALPRLIEDKTVRAKDVQKFLEKDFPPENLPAVDDAKKLVADYRATVEKHLKSERRVAALEQLKRAHERRRTALETERATLRAGQITKGQELASNHRGQRDALRADYLVRTREVKQQRYENKPTGLAAFLGRVSGVALIRKKLHKHQDKKRLLAYRSERQGLREKQRVEQLSLRRTHEMQNLNIARSERALLQVERKEQKSLEETLKQEARIQARGGSEQMPSLSLDLKLRGRKAVPHKDVERHTSSLASGKLEVEQGQEKQLKRGELEREFDDSSAGNTKPEQSVLRPAFARAATDEQGDEERGSTEGSKPKVKQKTKAEDKIQRYGRKRNKNKDLDRGR